METWGQKLQSRKFLLAVLALLGDLGLFLQGQIDANTFLAAFIAAAATFQGAEAVVDAARAKAS